MNPIDLLAQTPAVIAGGPYAWISDRLSREAIGRASRAGLYHFDLR